MRELKTLQRFLILCFALAAFAAWGQSAVLLVQTTSDHVVVGNTLAFTATHATAGDVTSDTETIWTLDSDNVATISPTGVLTAVAPGQVLVSVVNNVIEGTPSGSYLVHVYASDDADSDRMPDAWETQNGLNPNDSSDASGDPDQDGLTNIEEYQHQTKADDPDTDGDGRLDGDEVVNGLNPAVAEELKEPRRMDTRCVVSILNRVARVRSDGTWVLTNIPATGQQVRARATCQNGGFTDVGQSDFVIVPVNGQLQNVAINFDNPIPVPSKLTLTSQYARLDEVGSTSQLTATVTYSNNTTANATLFAKGTNYVSSNPGIATVSADGLVTAVAPGGVNISATNEGTLALLHVEVTGYTDTDHDGMSDDWETANGFNPNDAADADLDADSDGLTNVAEFQTGSDPRLNDTDGDGVHDGLEVQLGTSPIDPSSVDLQRALTGIAIKPNAFSITMTPLLRYVTRQIQVIGTMQDGATVDLTAAAKGTIYSSSDLTIANFENSDGKVAAGDPGTATITATNHGFTANAPVTVRQLPTGVSWLALPSTARNVKVAGNYAYVADGTAGLVIVDVTNRNAPFIVSTLAIPGGSANDVRLAPGRAYIAAGAAGLVVVNITDPHNPSITGSLDTPGDAQDVVLSGLDRAYLADGSGGVRILSLGNPDAPAELGVHPTNQPAQGVAVSGNTVVAVIGGEYRGAYDGTLIAIDVTDPTAPHSRGTYALGGSACDVAISGDYAYVAARTGGLQVIRISQPDALVRATYIVSFYPLDVAIVGNLAYFAEELRVNSVPIVNITEPQTLFYAAAVDLDTLGDADAQGLDLDERFVYVAADAELYIGQHHGTTDENGVAPVVSIDSPAENTTVVIGDPTPMHINVSDDFGIAQVITTINGVIVPGLSKPPYTAVVRIPTGTMSITIDVTATDFGGNTTHVTHTHTVGPDPGTTVVGRVVLAEGFPSEGADVTVGGLSATTGADGTYHIPNVSTVDGELVAKAVLHDGGRVVDGSTTPVTPVRGGTTNMPDIHLRAGLHASVTSAVPTSTTLVEWQPLAIVVDAVDDAPDRLDWIDVKVNGHVVDQLYSYDLPAHAMTITVPAGSTSMTIVAVATDSAGNVASSKPLTYTVAPDTGGTLNGVVKTADGNVVPGALVTIRESRYDGYGIYVQATSPLDAAFEELQTTTDANGAWSFANVNTYRGDVTATAVTMVNGRVQFMGSTAPQTITRGQTTVAPDLIVGAPASGVVAKLSLDTFGLAVEVKGDRMAVANGMGTHFFDVSNPVHPRLRSTINLDNDSWDWIEWVNFSDDGSKAVMVADGPLFIVADISDMSHPVKLSQVEIETAGRYPVSCATKGTLTAVAAEEVAIVDWSDPEAPVIVGRVPLPQYANYVYMTDHYVIVSEATTFSGAGVNSGIDVIDIADPTHPTLLGRVGLSEGVGPLVIRGTRAYAPLDNEINVFDFTDPAHPTYTPVATPLSPFSTWCATAAGDRILLAGDNNPGRLAAADPVAAPAAPVALGEIAAPETTDFKIPYLSGFASGKFVSALGWVRREATNVPWQIGSELWIVQVPESMP